MTKEITINAPEGAKIEGLQIEQVISQPADLEVGPVKVGDASVLTWTNAGIVVVLICLLYTSPSPRDRQKCRMPSSA